MRVLVFVVSFFIISSFSSSVLAEQLSTFNISNLNFNLIAEGQKFKFLVKPNTKLNTAELTANTFVIKNPSRLVIDIPGFSTAAQDTIALNNDYLSSIRVGKHKNKIRAVIDIKPDKLPEFNIHADQASQSLVISFSFDDAIDHKMNEKIEEENLAKVTKENFENINLNREPTITRTIENATGQTVEKKFIKSNSNPPTNSSQVITMRGNEKVDSNDVSSIKTKQKEIETLKTTQSTNNISSKDTAITSAGPTSAISTIKNILFQAERESGALVIEADKIGEYKITQKGKNLYELIINNSKLSGDHLTLPQFPPNNFKNFEVILTNQLTENSVQIKIYLNSTVELLPSIIDNKLWINTKES